MLIVLMAENNDGVAPTPEELTGWAQTYGSSHPILSDINWGITSRYTGGGSIGLPTDHLIAPNMEFIKLDTHVTEEDIIQYLP